MRRPLIEEYRRAYGLPFTVKQLSDDVRDIQQSTREGDITQNVYVSGGGSSGGGAAAAALTVQEEDGAPIDTAVTIIRVPNGGLVDNGSGDVSLQYALGASSYDWGKSINAAAVGYIN